MRNLLRAAVCAALFSGLGMSAANAGTANAFNGHKARNDVDGDGKSDLLYYYNLNGKRKFMYRIMDGNRVVREATFKLEDNEHVPSTGDFNGDGKIDLLFNQNTSHAEMWFGDGTSFSNPVPVTGLYNAGSGTQNENNPDVDGDGRSDIIADDSRDRVVTAFIMDEAKVVRTVKQNYPEGDTQLINVGDFNGDDKADLVFFKPGSTTHLMLFGNGDSFESRPFEYRSEGWSVLRTPTDVNGDGKTDLLASSPSESIIKFRYMDGTKVLGRDRTDLPADSSVQTSGDFDGDGKADLILRDLNYPENDVYFMLQGTGKSFKHKNLDRVPKAWSVID